MDVNIRTAGQMLIIILTVTTIIGWTPREKPVTDAGKKKRVAELYDGYRWDFPGIPEITPEEAMKLPDPVFVDVREPREQEVSMIPGAITDKAFLADPEAWTGRTIIGYCTISYRSGVLAAELQKKGIVMVNLRGGILGWLHAGGKVAHDGTPVKTVHVYGREWDLAPGDYRTVW